MKGRLRIDIGAVLLVVAFVGMFGPLTLRADVVPYVSEYGLLTTVTDSHGNAIIVPRNGVGVASGYEYSEISTPVGTFVRVPKLAPRESLKFTGLRDSADYWTFVFVTNAETFESTLQRVTTPTFTIGSESECRVSPCLPSPKFYGFAVIVHRPSAALTYVGSE